MNSRDACLLSCRHVRCTGALTTRHMMLILHIDIEGNYAGLENILLHYCGGWLPEAHFMMAVVCLLRILRWVGCVWRSDASISESPIIWNCVSSPAQIQTCCELQFYLEPVLLCSPKRFCRPRQDICTTSGLSQTMLAQDPHASHQEMIKNRLYRTRASGISSAGFGKSRDRRC